MKPDGDLLEPDAPFIPPGSIAFLPVSVLISLPVGGAVGLAPGGWSAFSTILWYGLAGMLYGLAMWRLAAIGLLPFPEE